MASSVLIGPFTQILTMKDLSYKGPINNEDLQIERNAGIWVEDGFIKEIGRYNEFDRSKIDRSIEVEKDSVALPGFIDCHTHICFAGSRYLDFEDRNRGVSYLDISRRGGGIWSTVENTRKASETDLKSGMMKRLDKAKKYGITTIEVKSGYGLSVDDEIKMLTTINSAQDSHALDVIPTCLAAHIVPREYEDEEEYLELISNELVPLIKQKEICSRFDIFIEDSAFSVEKSKGFLMKLKNQGFDITIHGDQFHIGGSQLAIECGALSVDHLEASTDSEIQAIASNDIVAVGLPGASIGLGCNFLPARKLLDQGACLAIASDWNPGSAPQGNLLSQASILATFEKLGAAEVFAGLTFRASKALGLYDRGILAPQYLADIAVFECTDYREILYSQGEMKPSLVMKRGELI